MKHHNRSMLHLTIHTVHCDPHARLLMMSHPLGSRKLEDRKQHMHPSKHTFHLTEGQPSLHGYYACIWFIGPRGHSGEIAGCKNVRHLFLLFVFFCLVGTL